MAKVRFSIDYSTKLKTTCCKAPPLANTPASGSQQATQLSPRAAPPAECHDRKIKSEVKPSNKRGAHYLVGFIRKMGRFTDRRDRFEEVIREMGVFTDGGYHLVGFVSEKGGFADRGIPESRIYQSRIPNPVIRDPPISESRNPAIRSPPISESRNPATRNPAIPESNPKSLSDSVFLKDLHDWFSDRFSPEGVAVVGRMDAVD